MKKFPLIPGLMIVTIVLAIVAVSCSSTTTKTSTVTSTPPPATETSTVTSTPPPATITVSSIPDSVTSQLNQLKQIAGPPPTSLDQYFPPNAPAPVFLIEMFNLAGPFEGIGVNLQEQDMTNVKASFQAFQAEYNKVSKMVPEWTSLFPADPVTALGTAIDSGNPAQIGPAMGGVGKVCSDCHLVNQVKVEQKYSWKNFDSVTVTNPVTHQDQKWVDYMTTMAGGFDGATVDLQEGKLDAARADFQAFQTEYTALAQNGCKQCHSDPVTKQEIPRKYYVDADSMALIAQLGTALNANPPDAKAIGNLAGAVGNSICLNCHLVHLPAQTAKSQWDQFSNILK
jgi:hypothetical protein